MDSSSLRSVNILGKRKLGDGLSKEPSEEKEPAVTTKTLVVENLSPETEKSVLISDIVDFFKTVGEVVRVQLVVTSLGEHKSCGFVEFASATQANKALHEKNGEYLHGHKISLDLANAAPRPKYCIDHKVVWKEQDYQERLLTEKDDLTSNYLSVKTPKMVRFCGKRMTYTDEGHPSRPIEEDETPPDFVEEVLFAANLSPHTGIPHIIAFFKDIGNVQVRLIVDQEGRHVGSAFVEFYSSNHAKKALEKKNGEYLHDHKIFLYVAKTSPYPPHSKCNLAEKLCYEDYLRRVTLRIEEDETVERLCKTPVFDEAVALNKKTLYVYHFSRETNMSHIIDFFKDVGGVVNVRLKVNQEGEHSGSAYVEFASANKANKALLEKNGTYLRDRKIVIEVANMVPTKYCIDHNVWYEDYLREECFLIKEDETETPDLVKEVDVTKRTLFVGNLPLRNRTSDKLSERIHDLIHCFNPEEVEGIVSFRLIVNRSCEHVGCAFVEFASANKAKKVLQKKNKQIHNRKVMFDMVKTAPYPLRPKYNLAEKLWYEDYLRQFGEDYFETEAKIIPGKRRRLPSLTRLIEEVKFNCIHCFSPEEAEGIVHVRLIVNRSCEHVGCAFVEFASANKAKKVLQKKNKQIHNRKLMFDMVKTAPYPLRPKYNLAEKLCYEDYLRQYGEDYFETEAKIKNNSLISAKDWDSSEN